MSIFTVTDDAFHGHPEPLASPDDGSETSNRYALQIVYYTKAEPSLKNSARKGVKRKYAQYHGAIFQPECDNVPGLRQFCETDSHTSWQLKCQCNYRQS